MNARGDETNGFELSVSRIIEAPRETAHKVWTDPSLITQWWGPHGMSVPECEMELRPGGTFRLLMKMDDKEFPSEGVFLDVSPQRIVFTDAYVRAWIPSRKAFMTCVTTFDPHGPGTLYTARARHWSAEDRDAHEKMGFHDGWAQMADRFKALVEKIHAEA